MNVPSHLMPRSHRMILYSLWIHTQVPWKPLQSMHSTHKSPETPAVSLRGFRDTRTKPAKQRGILWSKRARRTKWHRIHWENYISNSYHIEWDMIVVTVFLSILSQMEVYLVQNWKENCHHDHIPFNVNRIGNIVFSVQQKSCRAKWHRITWNTQLAGIDQFHIVWYGTSVLYDTAVLYYLARNAMKRKGRKFDTNLNYMNLRVNLSFEQRYLYRGRRKQIWYVTCPKVLWVQP